MESLEGYETMKKKEIIQEEKQQQFGELPRTNEPQRGPAARVIQYEIVEGDCWRVLNMCHVADRPMMAYNGHTTPVRRYAYLVLMGKALKASQALRCNCGHNWCINPKHMEIFEKSDTE